ncbi:hypothetical protein [uncultured Aquimarina sp.]|uniref:hypothetical protein n=1 Tax=uncultured Aquimarina sp. TaxID=575652 RepID=UPI00261859CA|nr:hypothetical protein [uncultured Aquimarina sp.]
MKNNNLHNNKEGFKVPRDYFENFEEKLFEKISKDDQVISVLPNKVDSGLKVPENYFDTLEHDIIKNINSENQESSILAGSIKTGLSTPDKYFENVENTILQKTINTNQEPKIISLLSRKNILYISGIAAMIAIVISISINKGQDSFSFDSVDIVDIQEYFDEGNAEFSDSEIAELLDEEINLTSTFSDEDITDEELENYLSDEELEDEIIYVE